MINAENDRESKEWTACIHKNFKVMTAVCRGVVIKLGACTIEKVENFTIINTVVAYKVMHTKS